MHWGYPHYYNCSASIDARSAVEGLLYLMPLLLKLSSYAIQCICSILVHARVLAASCILSVLLKFCPFCRGPCKIVEESKFWKKKNNIPKLNAFYWKMKGQMLDELLFWNALSWHWCIVFESQYQVSNLLFRWHKLHHFALTDTLWRQPNLLARTHWHFTASSASTSSVLLCRTVNRAKTHHMFVICCRSKFIRAHKNWIKYKYTMQKKRYANLLP